MPAVRYFLPDHPTLTEVYSKADLRALLQAGQVSRSDMVTDDETGLSHLLGDLLALPFPEAGVLPSRSTSSLLPGMPPTHEFRADTPLRGRADSHSAEGQEQPDEAQCEESEQTETGENVEPRAFDETLPDPDAADSQEDEELLYEGHPSWLAFPKSLLVAAIFTGSAIYFHQHGVGLEWIMLLGSVAGLIFLFIGLQRTTTSYYVTSRRVEMEFGIIGRNTKEVRIGDIRAIDVTQHGYAALVGIGTVKFDSSASAGPEVSFRNVRRPHLIKQLVRELQG